MAQLDFPVANADGQIWEGTNGVLYQYIGTPPNGHWQGTVSQTNPDVLSGFVIRTGDAMTGPLSLAADPTTNSEASTKQYVDSVVATAINNSNTNYVEVSGDDMTGNLTLGTDKITLNASTGCG